MSCAGPLTWPTHLRRKSVPAQQHATLAAFVEPVRPLSGSDEARSHELPSGSSTAKSGSLALPMQQHSEPFPAATSRTAAEAPGRLRGRRNTAAATAAAAICDQLALFWCLGKPPVEGQPPKRSALLLEHAPRVALHLLSFRCSNLRDIKHPHPGQISPEPSAMHLPSSAWYHALAWEAYGAKAGTS